MSNEISKNVTLPAHLQIARSELTSLGELDRYVTPPILKIVQKTSDKEWRDAFEEGTAVLSPQRALVSPQGEPFHFTPIFFYNEYIAWNPIQMKGTLQAIRERTFDRKSDLAKLCLDYDNRTMPCPENDKFVVKFQEHLNYVIVLNVPEQHPMFMLSILVSFSSTQHKKGKQLANLAKMRGHELYGGVYEAKTVPESNEINDWGGWHIVNPTVEGVSGHVEDAGVYEAYKALHIKLAEDHSKGLIASDYGSSEDSFGANDAESSVVVDSQGEF